MRDSRNLANRSASDTRSATAAIDTTGKLARVTVTVYVFVVTPFGAVTVTAISFAPSARLTSGPGAIETLASGSLAVAVTVVVATSLPTLAAYSVTVPANVPMSMPERLSALRVASGETDAIVTVAEPIATPSCKAATLTVSFGSCSWSPRAVSVAVVENVADVPNAFSVSVAGRPV